MDILDANYSGDIKLRDRLINKLFPKAEKIDPALRFIIYFPSNVSSSAKLVFLVKGNSKLKVIITKTILEAPVIELWEYQSGIEPYKKSIQSLCAKFNFIDQQTFIFQIYFAITKVYKTSNKLHLIIYLEMNKRHSKYDLHEAMETIFLSFLGDTYYYQHISKFKIVRRKFSAFRFMPFDELKNIIQFKHIN